MPSISPSPSPASLANGPDNWDSMRKSARQLESDIESKLSGLARLAVGGSSVGTVRSEPTEELGQVEAGLAKLSVQIDRMAQHLDSTPQASASMSHVLQRHRDVMWDFGKEFKKIRSNISASLDHASLLSSSSASQPSADTDYLLTERTRIDSSLRIADTVLSQAYATREDLAQQGRNLYATDKRLSGGVLARFPVINKLVKRIDSKKRRDACVLGSVVSVCVVFLVWWVLARGG